MNGFYDGIGSCGPRSIIAGGFAFAPIEKSDKALLMGQIETNLVSAYLCCRAAVQRVAQGRWRPHRQCGGAPGARTAQRREHDGLYGEPRPASRRSPLALAEEVAKDGILVNAVAPSIMDTPANRKPMPKADFAAWPKVEEVAATILFLASPENAVTRGAIVPVYGKS